MDDKLVTTQNSMKIVLMQAPIRKVTLNGGEEMPSWYDIFNLDFTGDGTRNMSMDELNESRDLIIKVVNEEIKLLGNDYSKIHLGGFS